MEEVLLARWQFGITTVYHWLFVPITLGITWMVAIMETAWVRTKNPEYLRMTKFWGKLMLINFAIGVATGIVLAVLVGMVIIGGIKRIGEVAATLVPLMCIVYMACGLLILAVNAGELGWAFATMVREAFSLDRPDD